MQFRSRRQSARGTARLIVGGRECTARLVNANSEGVQLAGLPALRGLPDATLMLGQGPISGRIVWLRDDRAGMQFLAPCSEDQLAALTGRIDTTLAGPKRRLELS